MSEKSNSTQGIKLDQNTMDVLLANIIPTLKYFESRFDNHLQYQLDELKAGQKNLQEVMENRFAAFQKDVERIDRRIDDGLRENRAQSMRMLPLP